MTALTPYRITAGPLAYTGLFASASLAIVDAMDRVPPGTPISARRTTP